MKRTIILLVSLILSIGVFLPICLAEAAVNEVQSLIDGIIGFKESETGSASVQAWIDGELSENAGKTSEWYVIALSRSGTRYDFSKYIEKLGEISVDDLGASSRLRCALALAAAGGITDDMTETVDACAEGQGIMSLIFALHLLNNGCESEKYSAQGIADRLLSLRLSDGGWALSGEKSDVDVTAMTLQALAPRNVKSEIIDGALEYLSAAQLPDGDYAGYGAANPESTAQVITALSSLGISCLSDRRFIKNGNTLLDGLKKYCLSDGSFCHSIGGTYNHASTTQAFYSLVALKCLSEGRGSLYILDIVNQEHTETVTEDSSVTTSTTPEATSKATDTVNEARTQGYKPCACIAIVGTAAIVCAIMFIRGKRRGGSYLFVLIIAGAAVLFVILTDFRSADEYYNGEPRDIENSIGTVSLSIRCEDDTVSGEHIPDDGIILSETEFAIADGDSVYTVLTAAARQYGIHIDCSGGSADGKFAYIRAIANIYEFDFGELSGWEYRVNGEIPSVGCGDCTLSDGDAIEWLYCTNSEGFK